MVLLAQGNIEGQDGNTTTVDFNGDGIPDYLSGERDGRFSGLRNPQNL